MKKPFKNWLENLKKKWALESLLQVIAILSVFSLAGSTVLLIRPLFFHLIGIESGTPLLLKITAYILFIIPTYQLLLFGYGWILGQQSFFIQKAKRLLNMLRSVNSN